FGNGTGGHPPFEGQNVITNSVLVRMTYMDDLTLQGIVSQDDAIIFGTNYDNGATSGRHWWEGDLTHDGLINQDDAILFGAFYDPSLPPLDGSGGGLASFSTVSLGGSSLFQPLGTLSLGGSLSVVPEPSSFVLLSLGSLAGLLMMIRRRK